MKFHFVPAPAGQRAARLWIMLPGAYMKPADFIAAGFVDALGQRQLRHDVALLEATIAQVADGSALRFLQDFLCTGAAQPGRSVGLLGISLGAQVAMACLACATPETLEAKAAARVDGACLLAPYLGPRDVVAEVAAAGALVRWQPPALAPGDIDRRIWRWLQGRPGDGGALHLGYGSEDRFASAHALMAQALPVAQVDVVPGGHDWPVWTHLWNRHLERIHVS